MPATVPVRDWRALRANGAAVRAALLASLREQGALSMDQLALMFPLLHRRQLHGFLTVLVEQGVIVRIDVALWMVVNGAVLQRPPRRRVYAKRTFGNDKPHVTLTAATQVGMVRDELVAALFGPAKKE